MLNKNQITTSKQILSIPWVVEPVLVERKRDSDGRFLKRNVKLNVKRHADDFNEILAAESFENAA